MSSPRPTDIEEVSPAYIDTNISLTILHLILTLRGIRQDDHRSANNDAVCFTGTGSLDQPAVPEMSHEEECIQAYLLSLVGSSGYYNG